VTLATALFGLTISSSCAEPEADAFGTIRIELSPVGGNVQVFAGTTEVVATVQYRSCLQDFYLVDKTGYSKDGPEGAPVFDEFKDKLCSAYDDIADCEVTSIDQALIESTGIYNLKVTLKILDPASLSYADLHIGPLPVEKFSGCTPIVELRQNGLLGRDANGTQIWRISSLPSSTKATTNQGAPLRVDIVRQD